ncbi:MFS transporter [Caballeronia ptereochthonis]|uniref:Major facilitator transporter n=1 Tax=Caballeronia ptereochthonis TaxID=1777144 RepID=A0A158C664_9BURK|nr:MFS transporter [Caballeronia ptereochthonis]SAK77792.1 major facilitator transporter [Caballeronia ptereochthonis]
MLNKASTIDAPVESRPAANRVRDVIAANFGTFFEWFDLLVYAMFALTVSKLFFPTGDEQSALLLSLLTFASSFIVRPVGAIVLGIIADKRGRRFALSLAAFLMLFGTATIAVVPTYDRIGLLAPVVLVAGRLLQGFSAGGEFGAANSFLTEQDKKRMAFFGSLQFSASGLAVLTSSLFAYGVNHYLSPEQINAWGWRLPFAFGCLIGPIGLYIRRKVSETPAFEETREVEHSPLRETAQSHKSGVLIGAVIAGAGGLASFMNIYMPTFAINNLGVSKDAAFVSATLSGVVCVAFPMIGGIAADRFGTVRVMRIALVSGMVLILPLFYMLTRAPGPATLIAFQCILSLVFYSFYYSPVGSLLSQLFPASCRTTGVSLAYVIAMTLFGGLTPVVTSLLVKSTGSIMSPAWYVIVVSALALYGLRASRKRVV